MATLHKTYDKIDAILNYPRPINASQFKVYLVLITFYCKFVPKISTIVYPLNQLQRHNVKFIFSSVCEQAFKIVEKDITFERILTHFKGKLPLILGTDSSPYDNSAFLLHEMPDNIYKPIGFV